MSKIAQKKKRKRIIYDQMMHSSLTSPASTQDFEEDFLTPEFELYEDNDGNGVRHARNVRMNQVLSHMTHTLVLR